MTDKSIAYVWSKCPYCNHSNSSKIEMTQFSSTHLVRCDHEDGGCDLDYAIGITWKVKTIVFALNVQYIHDDIWGGTSLQEDQKDEENE